MHPTAILTLKNKLLIVSMLLVFLLAMTGTALAGPWLFDPPIPETPYHLWIPVGASYGIETREKASGEVHFKVEVKYDCDEEETYEAGINESPDVPGNYIISGSAECGHTLTLKGNYSP